MKRKNERHKHTRTHQMGSKELVMYCKWMNLIYKRYNGACIRYRVKIYGRAVLTLTRTAKRSSQIQGANAILPNEIQFCCFFCVCLFWLSIVSILWDLTCEQIHFSWRGTTFSLPELLRDRNETVVFFVVVELRRTQTYLFHTKTYI